MFNPLNPRIVTSNIKHIFLKNSNNKKLEIPTSTPKLEKPLEYFNFHPSKSTNQEKNLLPPPSETAATLRGRRRGVFAS